MIASWPEAIVVVTLDGVVTDWNLAAQQLLGFTAAEMIGRPVFTLLQRGEDPDEVSTVLRSLAAGEPSVALPRTRFTRSGRRIEIETTVSALRDSGGRPAAAMAIIRDVSARNEAARTLSHSAAVIRSSYDAIISTDADGAIIAWNPAAARLYGFSAAEALGESMLTMGVADADGATRADVLHLLKSGEPALRGEATRRTKAGHEIEVEAVVSPVLDAGDTFIGVSAVVRDITARKRTEAALHAAEARFRSAFDIAPIGMVIVDVAGHFVEVNDAFCAMVGYARSDLVGSPVERLLHPDEVDRSRHLRRRLASGEVHALVDDDRRYLHANGDIVHVEVRGTLMSELHGVEPLYLGQVQDVGDRIRHQEQLRHLADHDPLTGLLNRRAFGKALDEHIEHVTRYGPDGALLVIDLDGFKFVNDTQGHDAGDDLIRAAASQLESRLGSTDVMARLGGDEFGVLRPMGGTSEAHHLAVRLLEGLRETRFAVGTVETRITASIGIAEFARDQAPSAEVVLMDADLAMYDAKEEGRDRVAVFSAENGPARLRSRMTWANRIQRALDHDRFVLVAQPIVELRTRTVTQYELLLRMQDDDGALIGPAEFLEAAERMGMMTQIDRWVVSAAIRSLAQSGSRAAPVAIEVNLSAPSVGDPAMLTHIEAEFEATGVDPRRVIFEITETAALQSLSSARAFGQRLASLGCRFAIDDFGAGFGGFYYLKHLYYDLIKIDGEFVRSCVASRTDQLLLTSIVEIARGLGKKTVAEFVGDEETVVLLERLGVDYGQGFHLGVPDAIPPTL